MEMWNFKKKSISQISKNTSRHYISCFALRKKKKKNYLVCFFNLKSIVKTGDNNIPN